MISLSLLKRNEKLRLKEEQREILRSSFSDKISFPKPKHKTLLETVIKFFIKVILLVSIPKKRKLNKNKNKELINTTYSQISSKEFKFIPSSTSFHFLVAFVPIISMVFGLLYLTNTDLAESFKENVLGRIIPGIEKTIEGTSFIGNKISNISAFAIIFASSLFLGSSGFSNLIFTQNYIYKHKNMGNIITNRFKGILIVGSITIFIYLSALTYLITIKLFHLGKNLSSFKLVWSYIFLSFWVIGTLFLGILLLFKMSPTFKLKWKQIIPGVIIASVPMILFTIIFGFISSLFDYGKYGIIGTLLYLSVFIYVLTYFMYLGMIANASYLRTYFTIRTQSKFDWTRIFRKVK
ncbi:Ribonuclease BN-like family [Mycoplasmopsis californica]|uniref:YihY/virulence factor BrkB family protein n=1 Tax=Mycoplasmopsis equigenitalium TaxID=114883 RepID=A0ABY5J2L2_9BACT|nr:YhjD/YihY/BrkB family envelope integrity protein [Mycoplasmopsis equigenitalium]UUD37008.1 YihY/virulence factor BrkB family protein [Mycoplasmopsis equigenitalium]VEU69693.1 Ribonuclease BN-like family [Mycoplasmopsis californica]